MTQSRRRVLGILLQLFGVLIVLIHIAAFLQWTPRLVHPWFMAMLALAALIGGGTMYKDKDQSDI